MAKSPQRLRQAGQYLQRFVGGTPMPRVKPFTEMGSAGIPIFGGYIISLERNSEWTGANKYKSASEIATNVSIVAAGVHYFLNLLSRPVWKVVPADDNNKEAVKLAEFVEDVIYGMETPWSRVVRRGAMYHFYGFAIQEWTAIKRKDGKIGFKDIEARSQYTIEQWVTDEDGSLTGVWQRSPHTNALLAIPRAKFLYLVEDTLSDSPEGVGVFRHMAEPWNRLKKFLELETMAFERDLRGTPIGRAPLTAIREAVNAGKITDTEGRQLIEGMKNFVQMQVKSQNTGMLLDSVPYTSVSTDGPKVSGTYQWGMELLQGSPSGLAELHVAIDRVQREMARVIGVESLMLGDGSGGNRALSEDKSKALYLIANSVLQNMAEQASKDLIDPLWDLNGFDDELKPWFIPEDVSFKDANEVSAVLREMATAGAVLDPRDPVVDDVRDLLGVSRQDPELKAELAAEAAVADQQQKEMEQAGIGGDNQPADNKKPSADNDDEDEDAKGKKKPKGGGKITLEIAAAKKNGFDKGGFDESKHPREPKGTAQGGRFADDEDGGAEVTDEHLKSVASTIIADFQRKSGARYPSRDDIQGPELEQWGKDNPNHAWVGIRYFGRWEVPADEEDDGDYDWKVPTDETARKVDAIIAEHQAKNPNLKIEWTAEEKEWISVRVRRPPVKKYDPNQPREPAGSSIGGRFASTGAADITLPPDPTSEGEVSAQALMERFRPLSVEEFEATLSQEVKDKIEWANGELAMNASTSGLVSEGGFKNEDGTWTAERTALHDRILNDFFNPEAVSRATPEFGHDPEFIMLGGRPGAGKTSALESGVFIGLDAENYLTINADEFQTQLPGYRGELAGHYSPEGQYIAERAEMLARSNRLNVIYDATMKSTAPAVQRARDLKREGYEVSSYFVHVAPAESARRAMEVRFAKPGGRYVPSKILLGAITNEKTFDTVRPIVDNWALFDGNRYPPHLVGRGGKGV